MPKKTEVRRLSLKQNMLWNSCGSLVYLGCQWLITVLVVRLSSGFDEAGTLSLAMSVYNMFSALAIYRMYTYQVSDISHENTVGEYFAFRIITCTIALGAILIYAIATCPLNALLTILTYTAYKFCSTLIDVLHGLDQQHHRMDYIGKSLMLQGAISLPLFCIGLTAFNNLAATFALMSLGIIAVGLLFDLPKSSHFERLNIRISKQKALHLLGHCLPIVIAAIACGAVPSIPRQYLSAYAGAAALGIYASVAAPIAIVQMGASYIYNPLLSYFSEAYEKKDLRRLVSLLAKATLGISILGITAAGVLKWLGKPLLVVMFGETIASYTYLITPMIACSMVTALVWFLSDLLVAFRHFRGSLIGNAVAAALSIPLSLFLVPAFGMNGVSFANMLAYGFGALTMLASIFNLLRMQKKHEDF